MVIAAWKLCKSFRIWDEHEKRDSFARFRCSCSWWRSSCGWRWWFFKRKNQGSSWKRRDEDGDECMKERERERGEAWNFSISASFTSKQQEFIFSLIFLPKEHGPACSRTWARIIGAETAFFVSGWRWCGVKGLFQAYFDSNQHQREEREIGSHDFRAILLSAAVACCSLRGWWCR